MQTQPRWRWLLLAIFAAFCVFYLSGLQAVPFHPDETTYLFQSQDFERYFTQPLSLAWSPDLPADPLLTYRTLDAPLVRYFIGLGRRLAGFTSADVRVDWDWTETWDENEAAGAVPSPKLLFVARLSTTLPVLAGLVFVYLTGEKIGGKYTGLAAALFFGLNALVLLHGRRAMAEGPMFFGLAFAIWSLLQADRRPWLAGLGAALAGCAKYSAAAIFPVGLLASCWVIDGSREGRKIVRNAAQYLAVFGAVVFILHPLLWRHPIGALGAMWEARQDLLERQVAVTEELLPEHVLRSPGQRAAILLGNLYVAPLSFYEVGNYAEETSASETAYLDNPLNDLLRGPLGGAFALGLTLAGLCLGVWRAYFGEGAAKRNLILLATATALQFALLLSAVPLPTQRYPLPLLPYLALWMGLVFGQPIHKNKTPAG